MRQVVRLQLDSRKQSTTHQRRSRHEKLRPVEWKGSGPKKLRVAAQGSELDVLEAWGPCSPRSDLERKKEVPDVHVAATCTLQVAGMFLIGLANLFILQK
jgi:hypothetical protein